MRAVVGADNYAANQQNNDQDYKMLMAIATWPDLPPDTVDAAYSDP